MEPAQSTPSAGPDLGQLRADKMFDVLRLKDYAIASNLPITDDLIRNADEALANGAATARSLADLDIAIRDLTALTYPVTAESIRESNGKFGRTFLNWVAGGTGFALCLVLLCELWKFNGKDGIEAAVLGFLGASTFIFFNALGLISEKAFRPDDIQANLIRLLLGATLGWVFFYALQLGGGSGTAGARSGTAAFVLHLLPFLAGFSTRLVVGLLTQAIRAAEITLGIDNKSIELLARRRGPSAAGKLDRDQRQPNQRGRRNGK